MVYASLRHYGALRGAHVFCGCDTIALESLMVGAIGWIGGVVNALPEAHVKLYQLTVVKKNYPAAQKLFFQLLPLLELMEGAGKYTQFVKAACGLAGHPVGPPRAARCSWPPLRSAPACARP